MKRIYLDHNATSPLREEVRAAWLEAAAGGNPSSLHAAGRRARARIDAARERVALALDVDEETVHFTSGGTESNNVALFGSMELPSADGSPAALVTSAVEHSSVLEPARVLAARGHPLSEVPVDETGRVRLDALETALARAPVRLVSIQAANNEVGTLQPLPHVARLLDDVEGARPVLHVDAVQALGRIPLDWGAWKPDLVSFSAHKVGGPPGVGILLAKPTLGLRPLSYGGGQEGGLRPGTEDVAGIVAAALAIELAVDEQVEYAARCAALVNALHADLVRALPALRVLGPALDTARLPNTLCIAVPAADELDDVARAAGKVIVTRLDLEGLEVSAGSACASGSIEPSHVLLAMGCDETTARASVRMSLGRDTDASDCQRVSAVFQKVFGVSHAT